MSAATVTLTGLDGFPLVRPGDDLAALVADALRGNAIAPRDQDVLVLAQKVVSKAEGRTVRLRDVTPGPEALRLARETAKDARLVELILSESRRVVRARGGLLIVEHRLGYIMANAGIDQSNIAHEDEDDLALLLPLDPDASCARIKAALDAVFGADLGVIVNDSFGRPWRQGVTGVALGAAGLPALLDMVGQPDLFGRAMRTTEVALADELAAAASLVMGQANEGRPVIHIRGASWTAPPRPAATLIRPPEQDLFR